MCARCKLAEIDILYLLRINTDRDVMTGNGRSRVESLFFFISKPSLYSFLDTKFGCTELMNTKDHSKPVQKWSVYLDEQKTILIVTAHGELDLLTIISCLACQSPE